VLDYRGLFEGWEIALAKELIDRFRSRWRSLEREGSDDLLQECLFHWYGVRNQFDPRRELLPRAFMARVVRNKLADLARERGAAKRGGEADIVGLDDTVGASDSAATFAELADLAASLESSAGGALDAVDARLDLARALRRLDRRQRRVCALLIEHEFNLKAVAQRLRTPRAALYEELKKIKVILSDQRLGEYLRG